MWQLSMPTLRSRSSSAERPKGERHLMSAPAIEIRANTPVSSKPGSRRWLTPAGVLAVIVVGLLYVGWHFPTERYITPERGLGYTLGIVGGSMMLLLFTYSARKRFPWLAFMGPTVH